MNMLPRHDLFQLNDATTDDLEFFFSGGKLVSYKARQVIFTSGTLFNGIYLIQKGIAKVIISLEGDTVSTALALSGDVLGVDSFYGGMYVNQAVCIEPVRAIWIPADCFYRLAKTNEKLRDRIMEALGKAFSDNMRMINLLSNNNAEARVAFLLLKLYLSLNRRPDAKSSPHIRFSRADMASYLGMRIETVSRKLASLSKAGYIDVKGRQIAIRDSEGLRRLCNTLPYSRTRQ